MLKRSQQTASRRRVCPDGRKASELSPSASCFHASSTVLYRRTVTQVYLPRALP